MLDTVDAINRSNDSFLLPPFEIGEQEDIHHLRDRSLRLKHELGLVNELIQLRERELKINGSTPETKKTANQSQLQEQ